MRKTKAFENGNVERLLLKKIEVGVSERIPGVYFQDVEWETHIDHAANDIVFRLRAFLYGQESVVESEKSDYIDFPTSWFQMFKQKYFPEWLLKRYPVQKKRFPFKVKTVNKLTKICPHLNVKSQREHLEFFMTDDPFKRPL